MQPLNECPAETLRQINVVLCDIDDTLTWQGKLPAFAYTTHENLQATKLIVVPITGRPAGRCGHIAHMWPVNSVVGGNGAFYLIVKNHPERWFVYTGAMKNSVGMIATGLNRSANASLRKFRAPPFLPTKFIERPI